MKTISIDTDGNGSQPTEIDRMHAKQIADLWGMTTRQFNKYVVRAEEILGYDLGEKGERNRTYYSSQEMFWIKQARLGVLQKLDNSDPAEPHEQTDSDTEADGDRIRDEKSIVKQQSALSKDRIEGAYAEGAALAKDELRSKVKGYVETRAAGEAAFQAFVKELDNGSITIDVEAERPTSQKLLNELF